MEFWCDKHQTIAIDFCDRCEIEKAQASLRAGNAAAREVFTEEKYPLHPRIARERERADTILAAKILKP